MITLKFPINLSENFSDDSILYVKNIIREFNSIIRFSYNRFVDGLDEKTIRQLLKSKGILNNYNDSWFTQCGIKEGKFCFEKNKLGKMIFGSKKLFKDRSLNKISKDEFRSKRQIPLTIQGEAPKFGNRKFVLDIIENNQIIFKPKMGLKIKIHLPKLRNGVKKQLFLLEELSKKNEISFTIKLNLKYIFIIFDELKIKEEIYSINLNNSRIFGIDMNPNYLGWSILEFDKNNDFKVLDQGVIENKEFNKNLKIPSNSKIQIYQNNKKTFELFEVSKFLIKKALFYKCKKFSLEELSIESKNHKLGRKFNRLVNNCWNRNKLASNLKKRCNLYDIEYIEVNPVYSSFIGNVLYGEKFPDMISSSIEISRRGYHKFKSGWFYPKLIDFKDLSNQWKKEISSSVLIYKDWKELFQITKTLKLKYRSSLEDFKESSRVFSLNNIKSKIILYSFI